MSDIPKPTSSFYLVLLALLGAGVGFLLHGSAGEQPALAAATAPAPPSVVPIVISGLDPSGDGRSATLHVNIAGDGMNGSASTASNPNLSSQAVAISLPDTSVADSRASVSASSPTNVVVRDYSVSIDGDNVVVAQDGSIVQVGDNGQLDANTGDASAGGSVGVDVVDSTIAHGTTTEGTGVAGDHAEASEYEAAALTSAVVTPVVQPSAASTDWSTAFAPLVIPTTGGVSIAGYEDHSVNVGGDDNLVTYDDSNVFVNRDGQINANTGDTDSSGLNVVDATDSVVRSGNSGDSEGNDEEEEEEEPEEVGISQLVGTSASDRSLTSGHGSPAHASVDDEDVTSSASGDSAFVIGGDGFDDLAIRVLGSRNVVTYDDGNVVVGGTGGVNAQIGDSDTGGAVVMGVHHSVIEAGCEGDLCPLYDHG